MNDQEQKQKKTDLAFPICWHATEKNDKEIKKKRSIVNKEEIFNIDSL